MNNTCINSIRISSVCPHAVCSFLSLKVFSKKSFRAGNSSLYSIISAYSLIYCKKKKDASCLLGILHVQKRPLKVLFIKNTSFYKLWSFLYCVRTTRKASRLFFLICTINVPFVTCHKAFVLTSENISLPKSHFLDVTSQKGWMFRWLGCTTHVF